MDMLSLRLFLRIAELGAVSTAARDLSLSPASASARLVKLEETLGFRLFNRTTRAVSLTTDGETFLPYAQQTLETLDMGLEAITGHGKQPQGLLRITMPGSFGRMYIIPALATFNSRYPFINLDLRLSDEVLDIVEGAYDLIIRNAPLIDSSMVARKLAPDRRLLVASPAYLQRFDAPGTPDDLATHNFISLGDRIRWKFKNGQVISVPTTHVVNDGEAMRVMVEIGLGIGMKSAWNANGSINSGKLIEILPDYPLHTDSNIWALYPKSRIISSKVRAMIEFLLELFSPPPWDKSPE